ncbi:Transcription initiation factor TFIID subunit A domain containing protein, partial [Russula decolorans]
MDPKIEPNVEDLLLDIADEFTDSATNFGCRLAKHRGGDTTVVRDLQLHLGTWIVPPLLQASWHTYHRRRTQSQYSHSYRCRTYHPERTKHKR